MIFKHRLFKKLMKFKILASKKDPAAMNIAAELEKFGAKPIYLETDSIHSENIDKQLFGDIFIFISRHKSEQKSKTLTIHAPGNWRQADLADSPKKSVQQHHSFLSIFFKY